MSYLSYFDNRIADYHDAETLNAIWITTPEAVAELLPPPLEPLKVPLAAAFVARYPKVSFGTPYMAGALALFCTYQGEQGSYILAMPEDDDYPVFLGREVLGFPKKMGALTLTRDGQTMEATVERRGVRLLELRAELTGEVNSPNAIEILSEIFEMPEDGATTLPSSDFATFLFKFAHGAAPDAPFEDPPRLIRQVTTSRPHSLELGAASVVLQPSPNDSPWGKVPVLEMLGVAYTVSHNTMNPGAVVAEVNEEQFYPYSMLKYEW